MITAAILTVSDSTAKGIREDLSGPALRKRCEELGWAVQQAAVVADDADEIVRVLADWADRLKVQLILTTGGTGISPRDVTPEGTKYVIEREVPGLTELMRLEGRAQTRFSVLSRGVAGMRGQTLIVNLPGSPKGAVQSLNTIADVLPHAIDIAAGRTAH